MLEYYSRYFIVFKKNCIYKNVYWHLIIFLHVGPFIFNCNVRQITFRYSQKNENSYLKGAHFLACFFILLKFLHLFMIRLCTTKIWLYVSDSVWSLLDCLILLVTESSPVSPSSFLLCHINQVDESCIKA